MVHKYLPQPLTSGVIITSRKTVGGTLKLDCPHNPS